MTTTTTLQDARREHSAQDEQFWARNAARRAKTAQREAKFFVPTNLHPAIGVLVKATGVTFYAYLHGSSQPITKGTVEELTAKLRFADALTAQKRLDAVARFKNGQ